MRPSRELLLSHQFNACPADDPTRRLAIYDWGNVSRRIEVVSQLLVNQKRREQAITSMVLDDSQPKSEDLPAVLPELNGGEAGQIEPPIVRPVRKVIPWSQWIRLRWKSFEESVGEEVYGAPRIFDLYTMLAITLAFAMLFAVLRFVAPAFGGSVETLTVWVSLYVAAIALAQAILFEGNNPRLSSVIAGPPLTVLAFAGFLIASAQTQDPILVAAYLVGSLCFGLPSGLLGGYLGGGAVAGVFLIADAFRARVLKSNSTTGGDATFDDLE